MAEALLERVVSIIWISLGSNCISCISLCRLTQKHKSVFEGALDEVPAKDLLQMIRTLSCLCVKTSSPYLTQDLEENVALQEEAQEALMREFRTEYSMLKVDRLFKDLEKIA